MHELYHRLLARRRDIDFYRAAAYLALALVLLLALTLRFRAIDRSLPYPQHVDEFYLTDTAANMLKTGDFNPHFFMYGGLPIYLTAAAMTYGYLDAANHLELQNTAEIGSVQLPYYEHPRVVRPARRLFAMISVLGLALLAYAALKLSGHLAMVLAPAWLAFSSLYFEQSQLYLNVNIVGSAIAWAAICLSLHQLERPDWLAKAIFPGILAGMVVACKYNFASILLAPLLAIAFFGGQRRGLKVLALMATTGVTFLLCAPYTLLDFRQFLDDLGKITYIYHQGDFGSEQSATFLGHLRLCLTELQADFGPAGGIFVLLGAVSLARADWRRAALVAFFPLWLFLQMCSLPTHLIRNLVPFLPLWALLGACGLVAAAGAVAAGLARLPKLGAWPLMARQAAAVLLLLALVLPFLPLGPRLSWLSRPVTSRQDATAWLLKSAAKDQPILIAKDIGLHPGELKKAGFTRLLLPLRELSPVALRARLAKYPQALVLLPRVVAIHWEEEEVEAGRARIPRYESFLSQLDILQEFGSEKVSVCFEYPPSGDPQFVIGRPRPPAAEAAARQLLQPEDFHGEVTQLGDDRLTILAQRLISSKEIELPAGSYRLEISTLGSLANGRYPVVRAAFGELALGTFVAGPEPTDAAFDIVTAQPLRASLTLEMLNDEVELDAKGKVIADRNVWLYGAMIEKAP